MLLVLCRLKYELTCLTTVLIKGFTVLVVLLRCVVFRIFVLYYRVGLPAPEGSVFGVSTVSSVAVVSFGSVPFNRVVALR